jgi:hypothetical protein
MNQKADSKEENKKRGISVTTIIILCLIPVIFITSSFGFLYQYSKVDIKNDQIPSLSKVETFDYNVFKLTVTPENNYYSTLNSLGGVTIRDGNDQKIEDISLLRDYNLSFEEFVFSGDSRTLYIVGTDYQCQVENKCAKDSLNSENKTSSSSQNESFVSYEYSIYVLEVKIEGDTSYRKTLIDTVKISEFRRDLLPIINLSVDTKSNLLNISTNSKYYQYDLKEKKTLKILLLSEMFKDLKVKTSKFYSTIDGTYAFVKVENTTNTSSEIYRSSYSPNPGYFYKINNDKNVEEIKLGSSCVNINDIIDFSYEKSLFSIKCSNNTGPNFLVYDALTKNPRLAVQKSYTNSTFTDNAKYHALLKYPKENTFEIDLTDIYTDKSITLSPNNKNRNWLRDLFDSEYIYPGQGFIIENNTAYILNDDKLYKTTIENVEGI